MNELKYFYTENGLDLNVQIIKDITKDGVRHALSQKYGTLKEAYDEFNSIDNEFMFDNNISDDCVDFIIVEDYIGSDWGVGYYIYSLEHYIEKCKITLNELLQYKDGKQYE